MLGPKYGANVAIDVDSVVLEFCRCGRRAEDLILYISESSNGRLKTMTFRLIFVGVRSRYRSCARLA